MFNLNKLTGPHCVELRQNNWSLGCGVKTKKPVPKVLNQLVPRVLGLDKVTSPYVDKNKLTGPKCFEFIDLVLL